MFNILLLYKELSKRDSILKSTKISDWNRPSGSPVLDAAVSSTHIKLLTNLINYELKSQLDNVEDTRKNKQKLKSFNICEKLTLSSIEGHLLGTECTILGVI